MPKAKTPKTNTELPSRAGDTRRQGKKSVNWREDPEILERLVKVAQLMNKNKRSFEIAKETRVSLGTAKLDISRVREIWKKDAKERIAHAQDNAIAQYSALIGQAWTDMQKVKATNPARAAFQNVILRAQGRMDTVSGIADKVEHSGPDGGPIEHKVVDVENIRKKRWDQVSNNLAQLARKESNGTTTPEADKKPE